MLRLATDADVHGAIVRGVRRHAPGIDLIPTLDVLPEGTADPDVLAWAGAENRVLITNDCATMIAFANRRVAAGERLSGLIVASKNRPLAEPSRIF